VQTADCRLQTADCRVVRSDTRIGPPTLFQVGRDPSQWDQLHVQEYDTKIDDRPSACVASVQRRIPDGVHNDISFCYCNLLQHSPHAAWEQGVGSGLVLFYAHALPSHILRTWHLSLTTRLDSASPCEAQPEHSSRSTVDSSPMQNR